MNARVPPTALASAGVTLLATNFAYDADVKLDLYGTSDDEGHWVKRVHIAGTTQNVTSLLRFKQLEAMGKWLDLKDSTWPVHREWAERHRREVSMYLE